MTTTALFELQPNAAELHQSAAICTDSVQILPSASSALSAVKSRARPLEVHEGSVTVRVYPGRTSFKSRGKQRRYKTHVIVYFDAAGRHRERRASLEDAKTRAGDIARSIASGQSALGNLGPQDWSSYLRARELLAPAGKSLELACSEYAEMSAILSSHASHSSPLPSPADLARYWLASHPAGIDERRIPRIVEELLYRRTVSGKYRRNLAKMLERLAARFDCPLTALQSRDVDDWLDSLGTGLRTRRNHRDALENLVNFARQRGYVPETWKLLDLVSDPEPPAPAVNLYTPEELLKLLHRAESTRAGTKLVPLIAITAFAGIRHGEMNEEKVQHLDWADIDWDAKRIYVGRGPAKTGNDRTVDMPDNLVEWLLPYRRRAGKLCVLANTSSALCRLRHKAAIAGPKRNALRKSFISYKLALTRDIAGVADQAGNSAAIIRKNYKRSDTRLREAAARWFTIRPERADVLPLFAWGRVNK